MKLGNEIGSIDTGYMVLAFHECGTVMADVGFGRVPFMVLPEDKVWGFYKAMLEGYRQCLRDYMAEADLNNALRMIFVTIPERNYMREFLEMYSGVPSYIIENAPASSLMKQIPIEYIKRLCAMWDEATLERRAK